MRGVANRVRDAAAGQEPQFEQLAVPEGYQRTDVGVIPYDWEAVSLSKTAERVTRGASPRPIDSPVWFDEKSSVGWVRISDVTRSGRFLSDTTQKLSEAGIRKSRPVPAGSLIMSICATVGRPIETRIDTCIHDGFVVFQQPKVEQSFLYYLLVGLEPTWSKHGQTGSQMNLNTGLINNCLVPLPNSTAEQRAIAQALSDVDELLNALEVLIAKKRAIKQAAMQQLLTGRTRLPGFSGEWETRRLGDVLTVCHGRSQREVEIPHGPYPILATGGQIGTTDRPLYDKPSVLIGRKGTVDQPQYMETPFWTVDTLFYCAMKSSHVARFFYYRFWLIDWHRYNEASGVPSLNAKTIENIEVVCPNPSEQATIASVLADMDAEITALERRRDKTLAIKEGMMQQLLTGRVRLVDREAVE